LEPISLISFPRAPEVVPSEGQEVRPMAVGKFEGLSEVQWAVLHPLLPPAPVKRGKGMPHTDWRCVLNTILYVLITGCRWCDVPQGSQWAPRSTAHRWLGRWHREGIWQRMLSGILAMAELAGLIHWESASIDGSFSPGQGRWRRRGVWAQGQGSHDSQPGRGRRPSFGGWFDSSECG